MRWCLFSLLEFTFMISYALKFCQGFSRPLPKETLQIALDVPATVINRSKMWFDTNGETSSQPDLQKNDIKIISYNILGPLHGESEKHDYAPLSVTKWTRRRSKLIDEIRELSADLICLQEVSAKGLRETFIPNLKHIGLECFGYAPSKTADAVKGKYGHKYVGCAIFGRPSKFNIISSKRVHLRDFGGASLELSRSHSFHVDYVGKWNPMAMTMLRVIATNQTFCIANTHLFWNPLRADIKAMQTYACMDAINKFCLECGYSKAEQPPLVLCGDFNTMPDMGFNEFGDFPSAPFELLESGELPISHPQHPDLWYSTLTHADNPCPRLGPFSTGWKLMNVFKLEEFQSQKPFFTTKTDDFQGWIDHIFVSDKVSVKMVLTPPICSGDLEANQKARAFDPIPNKLYPSDHLPLGIVVSLGENMAEVVSIDLPGTPYVLPSDENDSLTSEGIQVLSKE